VQVQSSTQKRSLDKPLDKSSENLNPEDGEGKAFTPETKEQILTAFRNFTMIHEK
jgi:hypothetical protein